MRNIVLNLILKKKCTGGCYRELEHRSEAIICAGPCMLPFCPECAYDQGTYCLECKKFFCHACWETISNNGCPFCDQFSESNEQEENDFKHVSAGEDDSTTKQEEEDVESVYSTHHRKFQKLGE